MSQESNQEFRNLVKEILNDLMGVKQISAYKVAHQLGCGVASVYRWSHGKTEMPLHYAIKLATIYPKFLVQLFKHYRQLELAKEEAREAQACSSGRVEEGETEQAGVRQEDNEGL